MFYIFLILLISASILNATEKNPQKVEVETHNSAENFQMPIYNFQPSNCKDSGILTYELLANITEKNIPLETIKNFLIAGACPNVCMHYIERNKDHAYSVKIPKSFCVIFLAAKNEREDLVDLLIKYGANINQKRSGDGYTPLCIAVIQKNKEAVRILLKYGANPFEEIANMTGYIIDNHDIEKMIDKAIYLQIISIGLKVAGALSTLTCLYYAWYESKDGKDKPNATEEKNYLRKFFALSKRKKKTVAFALGAAAFFVANRFGIKMARKVIFSNAQKKQPIES